jgi:peptide/nickel transport system substrate-binding protein
VAIAGRFEEIAQLVQAQLRQVGIELQVRNVAFSAYIDALIGKAAKNLIEIIWWFPDPSLMNTMFGSQSLFNGSRWKSVELDQLITEAAGTADEAQRRRLYRQAQQLVVREAVIVPVVENPTIHLLRKSVEGYAVSYLGFPLFYDTHLI